ncbi:hypothetical protein WJX73_009729 [Symbiochloris irregularis]|uniref:IFT52 GIFT domain-containing protein n=1 Tax=Symbiochloris irregularis TaxID=706552 RepID=A0AAW1NYS8_9CHLO
MEPCTVLFLSGTGEAFAPKAGLGKLCRRLRSSMHVGTVDAAALSTASATAVLVCAAPEMPFTTAHMYSLQRHIEAGGALLLLLQCQAHSLIGASANALLERFSVQLEAGCPPVLGLVPTRSSLHPCHPLISDGTAFPALRTAVLDAIATETGSKPGTPTSSLAGPRTSGSPDRMSLHAQAAGRQAPAEVLHLPTHASGPPAATRPPVTPPSPGFRSPSKEWHAPSSNTGRPATAALQQQAQKLRRPLQQGGNARPGSAMGLASLASGSLRPRPSGDSAAASSPLTPPTPASPWQPSLARLHPQGRPAFVYPSGCTLRVSRPAAVLLSSGEACHPHDQPLGALWTEEGKGRVAVLGSAAMLSDDWLSQEDNAHIADWLFRWLAAGPGTAEAVASLPSSAHALSHEDGDADADRLVRPRPRPPG